MTPINPSHRNSQMITSQVERISPGTAEKYLALNLDKNRPIRPSTIRDYSNKMLAGEWVPTHQGIAFDQDGHLIDGQHRLRAIVDSGVTVQLMVTRGLRPDSFKALDLGARRKMSDILRIPKTHSEVALFIAKMVVGHNPTTGQVERVYNSISPSLISLLDGCGTNRKTYSSATVKAAAVFSMMLRQDSAFYVKRVYHSLVSFDLCDPNLPMVAKAFIRQCETNRVGSQNQRDLFARSVALFDPSKEHNKKIQINTESMDAAVAHLRAFFSSICAA